MILGVVVAITSVSFLNSRPIEVVNNEIVTEVEVEVDKLSEAIFEALEASSTEHAIKAQEAYDAKLEQLKRERELEVKIQYRDLLNKGIETLEKEVGVY